VVETRPLSRPLPLSSSPGPPDQLIRRPFPFVASQQHKARSRVPRSGPSRVSITTEKFAMRIMLAVVITALGVLSLAVAAQSTTGLSSDYPAQAQGLPLVY
jgi:hypothetical protein